jgi:hypothetical protein
MDLNSAILSILGAFGLVFRIWLVQVKLKEELAVDQWHLSRTLVYALCLGMTVGFGDNVFTLIVAVALPTMIGAFLSYDITFLFSRFKFEEKWQINRKWVLIERLTLHPPMIIAGFYLFSLHLPSLLPSFPNYGMLFAGIILIYGEFFLLDPRWVIKQDYPEGRTIIIGAIAETVFINLYIFTYHPM